MATRMRPAGKFIILLMICVGLYGIFYLVKNSGVLNNVENNNHPVATQSVPTAQSMVPKVEPKITVSQQPAPAPIEERVVEQPIKKQPPVVVSPAPNEPRETNKNNGTGAANDMFGKFGDKL